MKKYFLLLCFCSLTIFATAQSKNTFQSELSVGGSAGLNLSSISFSPRVQQNMLMAYTAGFTTRWITERHCGIQLEINYSQIGWDELFEEPGYEYTRRLNYVDVPFMSHFYVGNRRVRAVFNLGPQIGYMIGESTSHNLNPINITVEPNTGTHEERTKSVEKKFAWGLTGGLGLEVRTGIGSFLIEGRYYYSLGDIYNNRKSDPFPRSAPQAIIVKMSYLLPLVKK